MDIQELKNRWQAYDTKLEKSFRLNMHCLEMLQSQKAKSKLKLLFISRTMEVIIHLVVLWYLSSFLYAHFSERQFAIPASILIIFFIIAFSNGVRQLIIIKQIDYSKSVTDIQEKLALLQAHIVDYVRLTFLVFPTYLAYPIITLKALVDFDITTQLNTDWWTAQIIFSLLLIPVCVWLYREVTYKNLHKKWVRFIIEQSAGTSVTKAMAFMKELDEFKKDGL